MFGCGDRGVAGAFAGFQIVVGFRGIGGEARELRGGETREEIGFARRRGTAQRGANGEGDAVGGLAAALLQDAVRKGARGLDELRVIQRDERLQRRVGARAAADALLARGRVENQHRGMRGGAFPERVHRAAIKFFAVVLHEFREVQIERDFLPEAGRLVRTHAGAADFVGEQSTDEERVVADEFALNAKARTAGVEEILGITFEQWRRDARALAIGRAGDELLERAFHVPAGLHEIDGEPVEHFLMRGQVALRAEILGRAHESLAEANLPEAIHRDARGERMLGLHEPLREAEAIGGCARGQRPQRDGHGGRDDGVLERLIVLAALEHEGRAHLRLGQVLHDHRAAQAGFEFLFGHEQLRVIREQRGRVRVLPLEKMPDEKIFLRGGAFRFRERENSQQRRGRGAHLGGRERAAVNREFVHLALELDRVRAAADAEGRRVRDGTGERVQLDDIFLQPAVHENLHARGLRRAIVGDHDVLPFLRREFVLRAHFQSALGPAVNEVNAGAARIEIKIPALKTLRVIQPREHGRGRAVRRDLEPARERKLLRALQLGTARELRDGRPIQAHAVRVESRIHLEPAFREITDKALEAGGEGFLRLHPQRKKMRGHDRRRDFDFLALGDGLFREPLAEEWVRRGLRAQVGEFAERFFAHVTRGLAFVVGLGIGDFELGFGVALARLHAAIARVIEVGVELIVLLLADGIVFVIVALRALHAQREPRRGGRLHAVHDVVHAKFLGNHAALVGRGVIAIEAGGDALFEARVRNEVAGDLIHRELIEGQIAVERADHPIAPTPHVARTVRVIHARIAVAREIHPRERHAFAEMRRGQRPIDKLLEGVRARIAHKRIDLRERRQRAREIKHHAANQRGAIGLGRGIEALLEQAGVDKTIDGVFVPRGVGACGQGRLAW